MTVPGNVTLESVSLEKPSGLSQGGPWGILLYMGKLLETHLDNEKMFTPSHETMTTGLARV